MKQKINWKVPLLVYGAMSVVFFFAFFYAALDNNYPVDFDPAVPGNSNFPEDTVIVSMSPALAFAWTWSFWRVLGLLIWFAVGAYMVMVANDMIGKNEGTVGAVLAQERNVWKVVALGMLIAVALFWAGHSNVVAGNNTSIVKATDYEKMKNDKAAFKALFDKKKLER